MKKKTAFTLIELLVVVAIIALLISILLPALSRAKEQGRIATCMSNLRQISGAANGYLMDHDDLPWALPQGYEAGGNSYTFSAYTSHIWGGGRPDRTMADWQNAGGTGSGSPAGCDTWKIPPRYRPMNKYLATEVSWDNVARDDPDQRRAIPMDLPGFFRCPSDSTKDLAIVNRDNPAIEAGSPYSTWEFWGSSYGANWSWIYYYQDAPPGNVQPYNGDVTRILGAEPGVRGVGSTLLRDKTGRWASEFIIFMEGRLSYALDGARPPGDLSGPSKPKSFVGWHRQKDYHASAYLDGSARYVYYNTRYVWGTGWTCWPNKPWGGRWAWYNDSTPDNYP